MIVSKGKLVAGRQFTQALPRISMRAKPAITFSGHDSFTTLSCVLLQVGDPSTLRDAQESRNESFARNRAAPGGGHFHFL